MKIDRSKLKKSSSEVPADCKGLIDRLTSTTNKTEFLNELQRIETWTYGKCELLHWIDVLDLCDEVLEAAAIRPQSKWALAVDGGDDKLKELVLWTLHFTTLLIEHSFSRHLYSSMEHLTTLLASSDLDVVLAVLNLLYMFSKRSNFIARLAVEKRSGLLKRLTHLAAGWGGRDNGFGLSKCCTDDPITSFPESATTLHFEFYAENANSKSNAVMVIHVPHVDQLGQSPATLMEQLLSTHSVPEEKQMQLFTYLRLACSFSNYQKRLKCVQARLQALSVLIYSNTLTENVQSLLYSGLLEELVEVLEMDGEHLMEIKASALKALTSIIHLDRNPNYPKLNTIIDVTGASSYHGFLPVMVRSCIASLTSSGKAGGHSSSSTPMAPFPQPLATALFSFLYHLASFEAGGEALVSCGMMESLLKVIQWPSTELDHITFVTRAVRVIDLITNLDMQSFQTHQGLNSFITRLELEVDHCRKQQPFQIQVGPVRRDSLAAAEEAEAVAQAEAAQAESSELETIDEDQAAVTAAPQVLDDDASMGSPQEDSSSLTTKPFPDYSAAKTGFTCLPQRAALLKSMLNFLKKAIQDQALSDSIRHVMDGSLPNSLKHIISNAEYYGPSLFLLATDVVTAYVFQEPSLLSSLQDNGLTDVVLHALLVKDVPATREVLGSLPNVFSALCLNTRGLNAFVECRPFERLFKVLLSPDYLPAMRRRRSSDPLGDTASNLGNAMDELMRHQPSLKTAATGAIIKLLEEVCALGRDPKYICWKTTSSNSSKPEGATGNNVINNPEPPSNTANENGGSSDEEEEDEEETGGNPEEPVVPPTEATLDDHSKSSSPSSSEKEAVPLVDYIHNVMKFVDAILSNNATDDHCREFVQQKGLVPLMGILGLPNLPIDFPTQPACQAVSAVSKSILNLAHEPTVLKEGLSHLEEVLKNLEPLHNPLEPPGGSVLLRELVNATCQSQGEGQQATTNPTATPLLHQMAAAHAYIQMFVTVNRTGQNEIRNILVSNWGSELGLNVLRGLSKLYTSLVWESNILLALCSEDALPAGCEFGKADMDKLLPAGTSSSGTPNAGGADKANASSKTKENENEETFSPSSGTSGDSSSSVTVAMENLSTDPDHAAMDVDDASAPTAATKDEKTKESKSTNTALHHQIKQIKPLLSVSSRLGRALVELFALLVKLCVGSPLRQRRGQQIPATPAPPSPPARAIASALTKLLASGLSWEPPPTSPIPKFRLTFFICSLGFTSPMLFDEKKMPYHLMLQKFLLSGGQNAFFDAFYWALSIGYSIPPEDGLDADLPEFTGEFLDSWLVLLEKMVNPKAVLESPHTLPKIATKTTGGNFKPFDPLKYLTRTHRLAFQAVMKIWGKKPLKTYGARMSESVLNILCHILKGEKLIEKEKEKALENESARPILSNGPSSLVPLSAGNPIHAHGPASPLIWQRTQRAANLLAEAVPAVPAVPPVAAAAPAAQEQVPEVNQTDVATLMDMGFPRERCIEALEANSNLDAATDYLLNNPLPPARPPPTTATPAATAAITTAPAVAAPAASSDNPGALPSTSRMSEQDDLMRAIEMSLGEHIVLPSSSASSSLDPPAAPTGAPDSNVETKTAEPKPDPEADEEELPDEEYEALTTEVIDEFASNALTGCLGLLDALPDTVYRVCDLLLAVFNRNGTNFKETILKSLIKEVHDAVKQLSDHAGNQDSSSFVNGALASKAAVRIHLFTLLFEECKMLAARIVDESSIISAMIHLLSATPTVLQSNQVTTTPNEPSAKLTSTPKWMTPLLLFIDLYEKVILGMNRRSALEPICSHTWKWFDVSNGKWCTYAQPNNKIIDDAFWAGESGVKIQHGRRKYNIQFGSMIQANEETGSRRPVMISLIEPSKPESNQEKDEEMSNVSSQSKEGSSEKSTLSKSKLSFPASLKKLTDEECSTLLHACVSLMGISVDADALNAILRLLLRLTRDFEQAVVFAQLGGVKMLLDLTHASSFSGFSSLATLLIKHVMEDPQTLKATIEKVIRSSTVNASGSNNRELHYLLRDLAPAACRAPQIFADVAREILRVDFNLLKKSIDIDEDKRLLLKCLAAKNSQTQSGGLHEVSRSVICDLLNFLVRNQKDFSDVSKKVPDIPNDIASKPTTNGANRTQVIVRNSSSAELHVSVPEGAVPPETAGTSGKDSETKKSADSEEESASKKRPLMTKATVCRLLAELVKSYGNCATLITEHVFEAGMSDLVKEDTTALAFLLDELLVSKSSECSSLIRILVAALASCNQYPEAQATLVLEVKGALGRALGLQESSDKHSKIQALAGLICTMIESCPSAQNQSSPLALYRQLQYNMTNMVKVMLKKGIITDLARATHNLDLSSPNVAATVNAILKPLETLSRIVNQPTGMSTPRTGKNKNTGNGTNEQNSTAANNGETNNVANANGTNTTNSEATRAQGDETVEPDPEATEHDVSTAAESIDPNSESQLHTVEDGNDEEFDDMMDQLLDRDGGGPAEIIAEALEQQLAAPGLDSSLDDTHHDSQMITQDESQIEAQQMSQDEEEEEDDDDDDHESESSQSGYANNDENDDGMEVEGEEEEDEDDEDDDEDGDDDEDEEDEDEDDEGGSPYNDQYQDLEDAIYRFPPGDNGDDDLDLMIHHPDESGLGHNHLDERMARAIHLPLWSDMVHGMGGLQDQNSLNASVGPNNQVSANHPLLMGRQATNNALDSTASRSTTRGIGRQLHRGLRGYLHLGSRGGGQNATAPTILQSFLGSNASQDLISHSLRRGTPLLVDFGYAAILDSLENEVSDIDNTMMGQGGRAALSSIPSPLVRWKEESGVIDGDSCQDCVTALKPQILEVVEKAREEEVTQRKAKKKAEDEEKEKEKKRLAAAKAEEQQQQKASTESASEASETTTTTTITPGATAQVVEGQAANASSTPNDSLSEISAAHSRMAEDFAMAISTHLSRGTLGSLQGSSSNTEAEEILLSSSSSSQNPPSGQAPPDDLPPPPPPIPPFPTLDLPSSSDNLRLYLTDEDETEADNNRLPAALAPLSPSPEQNAGQAVQDRDVVMRSENASPNQQNNTPMAAVSEAVITTPEATTTSNPASVTATVEPINPNDGNDPGAGPSGTTTGGPDYSTILGINVTDLPEGVDPSFLAALPEDMRQEVIDEQRRLQTIRQRAAQNTEAGVTEVNPEFLAALPPNIQEEVLAQQRIEQQRQAAQANPEAPVDPGEFLQSLPESLRQSVLADMEESQIPSLPAELAAQAQVYRRENEQRLERNRVHNLQERFFGNSNLSSILRNTVNRIGSSYFVHGSGGGRSDSWRHTFGGRQAGGPGGMSASSLLASASASMKFKGRQLLDQEGLSCLLIVLFIDDPKINTTRLHRILRNLCYHAPTREWVIKSLLSILEKSNDKPIEGSQANAGSASSTLSNLQNEMPPAKIRKSTSKFSSDISKTETKTSTPMQASPASWLNISMDAALGFRANVFQVCRGTTSTGGKKNTNNGTSSTIAIHPGASSVVCRHTLEVLISLAKTFSGHFLPWKESNSEGSGSSSSSSSKSSKTPGGKGSSPSQVHSDFWDTLLKLDQISASSKKGKSVARSHSSVGSLKEAIEGQDSELEKSVLLGKTFEFSPFGQLLGMLSSPVIRRNSILTDKLLRLLSLISLGQPDLLKKNKAVVEQASNDRSGSTAEAASSTGTGTAAEKSSENSSTTMTTKNNVIPPEHLKLAVEVLTSKTCSEEGLEDVTALLLNLSYGPEPTRDTILALLLQGAQELGNVVRQNILDLQNELRGLKNPDESEDSNKDTIEKKDKGAVIDRFTNEAVVVAAPSKVKGGPELQLPSMNSLTNKTSSQAFFLRVLKVIIQLRDAALQAMKKSKQAQVAKEQQAKALAAATAAAAASAAAAANPETTSTPTSEKAEKSEEQPDKDNDNEEVEKMEVETKDPILPSLSDQLTLCNLWDTLSACLRDLADTPDHHAVLVLQATVEAFFLVHAAPTQPEDKKKVQQKETRQEQLAHIQEQTLPNIGGEPNSQNQDQESSSKPSTSSAATSNTSTVLPVDTQKFLAFAETHRTVLNQILRQSTVHLADGPFSVLVDHTRVLDFDIKRRYFRTELERMDEGLRREDLAVHVRRENVFEDSFRELHRRSPEEWKNRFYIVFEGEEGQDAGGLLREWYVIISKEIFNPMYALFKTSPGDKVTYMIYEQSQTNPNHLDYFKFVGRVIAKAIYDNKHLECYFTRSFYKHILAKTVKHTDMESEDYAFYKGLEFLIHHKVEDLGYDLTFSTEIREFGVLEVRDLIPNGRNVQVTEDNKMDYIRLVCQMKMTGAIRKQLSAFLEGFYNVIPRRLISIFNEQELELLVSGLPVIDVDDLKANTEYHKYQSNSLQIIWFWRALRSFDQTDKAKFMQFVTGSSKVPLQGFAALEGMNGAQKFQIHRDDRSTDRLPSAHTCFNQLDLPAYETYDKLKTYLTKAIQECSEGFGFA